MKTEKLKEMCNKYNLLDVDVFTHKHYTIISRTGIDKIQASEKIFIEYDPVKCEPEFCVVKATAKKDEAIIQTFGSAKYGSKNWDNEAKKWNEAGNTTTWYVMEMAEKRAMSRAVLKLTGFYELGVFGEDESEDFKRTDNRPWLNETQFNSALKRIKAGETGVFEKINEAFRMKEDYKTQLQSKLDLQSA